MGVSDEWEGEMMMSTSTSATSVASRGSLVLKESGEEDEVSISVILPYMRA